MTRTSTDKNVLRASVLAFNDGICTNFSFVLGALGAGMAVRIILITGIVNILSGAFSMSLNEWNSLMAMGDRRIDAVKVGLYSLFSFAIGAMLPIAPLLIFPLNDAVFNGAMVCGCAVLLVGTFTSHTTKAEMLHCGLRSLGVGIAMAILTYACATAIPMLLSFIN
ncbi:hypothetical protein AB840_03780 [Megasphaera cerevisiae DSM 20462]|jgi:VIT1/CCC1 family predicted Fe2+/Mn2+ transporter|uniref:VIT family protein n=1 Tax=Megasphaera cerevisiae DSM 20462 TaxID=1122219 RepID=A0A0J6WX18_9FIRM|nr:VIT1/CCC1 transporter family protein [Megasphaera cerevisiae]KMO87164.1 hypothetical protein AB840_03780 [Megasphaera cerevisiae DSM 20462]SJZ59396.1 Uncharacterized membrane protein [Megasphaera cerevisiae DSM 20462]